MVGVSRRLDSNLKGLIGVLPKGPPAADDMHWCCVGVCDAWRWSWKMGILAECGAPGYEISAFAYGDLKIHAFFQDCGFGLIACAMGEIPFWGIAWLGLLRGTALGPCRVVGIGDAWDLGSRGVLR
jgi:hypothetical protein